MSLTEEKIIDLIEIVNYNNIQVRESNIIKKDGKEIARTLSRYVLTSGSNFISQDEKVKNIAKALWGSILEEEVNMLEAIKPQLSSSLTNTETSGSIV
jgi:hypothetical protein